MAFKETTIIATCKLIGGKGSWCFVSHFFSIVPWVHFSVPPSSGRVPSSSLALPVHLSSRPVWIIISSYHQILEHGGSEPVNTLSSIGTV